MNPCLPVNHLIVSILIKSIIKSKFLVFQIFGKIDFLFRFMDNDVVSRRYSGNINISAIQFCEYKSSDTKKQITSSYNMLY